MIEPISDTEFGLWKHEKVTKQFMEAVKELRKQIEEELTKESVILRPDGQLHLAYLAGKRSGLDELLNLSVEDLDGDLEKS